MSVVAGCPQPQLSRRDGPRCCLRSSMRRWGGECSRQGPRGGRAQPPLSILPPPKGKSQSAAGGSFPKYPTGAPVGRSRRAGDAIGGVPRRRWPLQRRRGLAGPQQSDDSVSPPQDGGLSRTAKRFRRRLQFQPHWAAATEAQAIHRNVRVRQSPRSGLLTDDRADLGDPRMAMWAGLARDFSSFAVYSGESTW